MPVELLAQLDLCQQKKLLKRITTWLIAMPMGSLVYFTMVHIFLDLPLYGMGSAPNRGCDGIFSYTDLLKKGKSITII
jgi:hypothetical protein